MFVVALGASAAAAHADVDPERSKITVHVSKSGLFRAFGDNHEVEAPVTGGFVDEAAGRVQVVVDARRMRVLDPNLKPHDREEVQARMLGPDVLDVSRFSEIRFQSTAAKEAPPEGWSVTGELTLHGQTRPVTVTVVRDRGHYKGRAAFKQTAFGITPVSVAGGTVKVKDEVTIDFDIVTRQP